MKLTIVLLSLAFLMSSRVWGSNPWDRDVISHNVHNNVIVEHALGNGSLETGGYFGPDDLTPLPRDLLFIVDMSGSFSNADWRRTKRQLADLVGMICGGIGRGRVNNRIAVITFSTSVVLNFNFKTHWNISSAQRAILRMPKAGGRTCTGDALRYAHSYLFNSNSGVRPAGQSIKEVLILTDGPSVCGANLVENVRRLQAKAFVFALGVGQFGANTRQEIESMVSRPMIDHIFSLANFIEFGVMVDIVSTYPGTCVPFELN